MSPSLSPRQELLQIQKRIFAQNNAFIRGQTLVSERGFDRYEQQYKRHVRTYRSLSNLDELTAQILESDIIYLGDYHTNKQSQRMLLRLLKILVEREKPPLLGVGLELVTWRYQRTLEDFLEGRITDETFLRKIRFHKNWYFDLWENFKPIFDFAQFHKMPLYGTEWSLSGAANLATRDRQSARIIANLLEKNPGMKFIIFVGDLHIAPEHLPREVAQECEKKGLRKRDLILYQNSETIYWKLAEEEQEEHVEVVRVSDREYCIMNTPPIVWQQSYLNWLEHEEDEIDYADAKHNFLELLRRMGSFLEIEIGPEAEDVEVFTCGDLSFLKRLYADPDFSRSQIRRIKRQILSSESYCLPERQYVYLANLSLNHASEEAAHYLKYLCSGPETPRDPVDAFYANILHEALGFFGSKIINHKRKCFHEKEYVNLISYLKSGNVPRGREKELEVALLVLRHKALEKSGSPIRSEKFYRAHPDLFFGVTHGLGYMLGDRLFYALVDERMSKEDLRSLFLHPMKGEGEPFEIYRRCLRKVRGVKIPKRV